MTTPLKSTISAFNKAFSSQQLEQVMEFFADDCEFRDPYGQINSGKAEVRDAIEKLFSGAFGQMTFIETGMVVDESENTACLFWDCEHQMGVQPTNNLKDKLTAMAVSAMNGKCFYWQGMDYFTFDENLKLTSKQTYSKSTLPKFVRGASDNH